VDKVQLGEHTKIRIGRIRKRPRQELNWVTYVQCAANTWSFGNEEWVIKMAKHFGLELTMNPRGSLKGTWKDSRPLFCPLLKR